MAGHQPEFHTFDVKEKKLAIEANDLIFMEVDETVHSILPYFPKCDAQTIVEQLKGKFTKNEIEDNIENLKQVLAMEGFGKGSRPLNECPFSHANFRFINLSAVDDEESELTNQVSGNEDAKDQALVIMLSSVNDNDKSLIFLNEKLPAIIAPFSSNRLELLVSIKSSQLKTLGPVVGRILNGISVSRTTCHCLLDDYKAGLLPLFESLISLGFKKIDMATQEFPCERSLLRDKLSHEQLIEDFQAIADNCVKRIRRGETIRFLPFLNTVRKCRQRIQGLGTKQNSPRMGGIIISGGRAPFCLDKGLHGINNHFSDAGFKVEMQMAETTPCQTCWARQICDANCTLAGLMTMKKPELTEWECNLIRGIIEVGLYFYSEISVHEQGIILQEAFFQETSPDEPITIEHSVEKEW